MLLSRREDPSPPLTNLHTHQCVCVCVDLSERMCHLRRPLHVAARRGLTVVVQELLGKEASVLAVDENGQQRGGEGGFLRVSASAPVNQLISPLL